MTKHLAARYFAVARPACKSPEKGKLASFWDAFFNVDDFFFTASSPFLLLLEAYILRTESWPPWLAFAFEFSVVCFKFWFRFLFLLH